MDLTWTPAHVLRDEIAARRLSPVELAQHCLDRIERLNPILRAYLTVEPDDVLAQARQAELGLYDDAPLGPLHGLPVSLKDNIGTKGLRTTQGSLTLADHVPAEEGAVVERLRAAGAIILGKTNTSEFALCGRTVNRLGPESVNPWDVKRTTAGSTGGGAAAVAAGLGGLAIGTDGGGSIRYPAAFNGVFGVIASAGRIPKWGTYMDTFRGPFSRSGPITLDVRDAAILLEVVSGWDGRDPASSRIGPAQIVPTLDQGVSGLRIGWLPPVTNARRDEGVEDRIRAAAYSLSELGAAVEDTAFEVPETLAISGTLGVAAAASIRAMGRNPATRDELTPYGLAAADAPVPSRAQELAAWRHRRELFDRFDALFAQFDLIATPTTCFAAPESPQDPWQMFADYQSYVTLPIIVNITGHAAAAVPCGFVGGLPISLQLIARRHDEATLFRACRALEQARPWSGVHPKSADLDAALAPAGP